MANSAPTAIFGTFPRASFGGKEFPYSQISIKGGLRHHVHEYPHSPGGDIEKMGRKLYSFRFRIPMHDLPGSQLAKDFPDLYPNLLINLRDLWDKETTDKLVVPNVGIVPAVAIDWDQTADMAESLSGETVNVEFLEDVDRETLVQAPVRGVAALKDAADNLFEKALAAYKALDVFQPSIFQAINDAVTAVDAIAGQGDQYSRLVAGKIEALADLCGRADREVKEFQDPMNHVMLEALKDLWANAVDLQSSIPGQGGGQLSTFRTPTLMSIGQVATRLYGSAQRGFDIMQINPIEDPFAIPAGTSLQYVRAA